MFVDLKTINLTSILVHRGSEETELVLMKMRMADFFEKRYSKQQPGVAFKGHPAPVCLFVCLGGGKLITTPVLSSCPK